jgi:glycosyltransferase involved in cell wall biosynthesis
MLISYSTYGKKYLLEMGVHPSKIVVATNVCNTDKFIEIDSKYNVSKSEAKARLKTESKIVVSFIGTLDFAKRPDLILEIQKLLCPDKYHFFIIGDGPMMGHIKQVIGSEKLNNVVLTGRVQDDLPLYYRGSDIVLVTGRGGIVVSEAMCFGLPVIVHQADGVEYDLIKNGENGLILTDGSARGFADAIISLADDRERLYKMGMAARQNVQNCFNSCHMAAAVQDSISNVLRPNY